jgi:NAD(P)-dependent dehydrogenase (short-subunit alcohol dehydrogenase family)
MHQNSRTALITGTVSGIGRATTERLVAEGWHVFATVMTQTEADDVKSAFGEAVTALIVDVTDAASIARAASQVEEALDGRRLDGLVNNAGVAMGGPAMELPIEEFQHQMDINVTGVLRVTQAFGPLLGTDKARTGTPGRIVMLSSVAGQLGSPFMAPYVASKHAVEGLSKCLRIELQHYGIKVIMIEPGMVATPIWEKAGEVDATPYHNSPLYPAMTRFRDFLTAMGPKGLKPEVIADRIFRALTEPEPRLAYAVVPDRFNNWTLPKLMPARMLDRIIARRAGIVED